MSDPDSRGPLDYRRPEREPTPEHLRPKNMAILFGFGLVTGVIVSVIIWIYGWDSVVNDNTLVVLPALKVMAAIGIIFVRPLRGFGIGLLVSIPIGGLIFGYQVLSHCKI